MPQEDKFKREIDRISLVLAKLLDLLLGNGQFSNEEVAHFMQQCDTALSLDMDEYLRKGKEEGMEYLIENLKFSDDNLRNFGHLLYNLAQKTMNEEQRTTLREKASHIYEYLVSHNNGTLYLDVLQRMKELR